MDSFLISAVLIPLISSSMVLGGLLSISILQLPTIRKNMRTQAEEQIYARIMEARIRLENTETFTKMAKESPIFAERFALVDTPQEYYTIMSFIDLIEFLHRLNKAGVINADVWSRWKVLSGTIMTIPKFKKVWNKTKDIHSEILSTCYNIILGYLTCLFLFLLSIVVCTVNQEANFITGEVQEVTTCQFIIGQLKQFVQISRYLGIKLAKRRN